MTMRSVFTKSFLLSASLATGFALLSAMHEAFAGEPVHGPGSSHNPIVYHPVHGPGSSHNPIVVSTSKYPPGTVVRDHRNGKNCQYTVGDSASISAYNKCEYGYSGGGRGGH